MNERDWTLAGELQRSKEQFKVIWEICRFKDTIGRSIPRQVVGAIEGLKRSIVRSSSRLHRSGSRVESVIL